MIKKNFYRFFFILPFFLFILGKGFAFKTGGFSVISVKPPVFFTQDSSAFEIQIKKIDSLINVKKAYGEALDKALKLYSFSNLSYSEKFEITFIIGNIYNKTRNYKRSLNYYQKALRTISLENIDSSDSKVSSLNLINHSKILLRVGGAFQKLQKNDSAMHYYKKLEVLKSLNGGIESYKAVAFSNMSGIYEIDSIYDKAELYSRKSIEIHKIRGDKVNEAIALNNLGNLFLSQGLFKKAKKIYSDGISLIDKNKTDKAIRYKASLYANLAWAMRNLEEYKAYDFLYDSYGFKDELRRKDIQQIVETVTRKHNVDIVKKEAEINAAKASRKTWIITISGISVILILLFVLVSYNLRQKNLQLTLVQKETEQKRKLSQLHAESQALILNAALDGKESERKEIAETLHDNVSTLLSSANLHLQACKTQFNGNTPIEVDKTQIIINEASQKIRDLSHTLVSSILLKFGLSFAVTDLTKKYSNSQLEFNGDIQKLDRYNQKFEIKVYNIIQELVNNILKHSEATKASIHLSENNKRLHILIKDNGKGFDKTKITIKDGLGINQIDARIKMMNGKFEIDSKKNKGTTILIELPILEVIETKNA